MILLYYLLFYKASGRAFPRTRLRTHGHNINQLVNILNGFSMDNFAATAISTCLVTTKWRPDEAVYNALYFDGTLSPPLRISHRIETITSVYATDIDSSEILPLQWSAGLIMHPDFIEQTKEYQNRKKMTNNTHLWPLAFLSTGTCLLILVIEDVQIKKGQRGRRGKITPYFL